MCIVVGYLLTRLRWHGVSILALSVIIHPRICVVCKMFRSPFQAWLGERYCSGTSATYEGYMSNCVSSTLALLPTNGSTLVAQLTLENCSQEHDTRFAEQRFQNAGLVRHPRLGHVFAGGSGRHKKGHRLRAQPNRERDQRGYSVGANYCGRILARWCLGSALGVNIPEEAGWSCSTFMLVTNA